MGIVVDTKQGRQYVSPIAEHEDIAFEANPKWKPFGSLPNDVRAFTPILYGLTQWSDLFTSRQICALTTMNDLLKEIHSLVVLDTTTLKNNDQIGLDDGNKDSLSYADLIVTYLLFAANKHAMYGNSLVPWYTKEDRPSMLFTQQVVQMTWDFCEVNPLSDIGGSLHKSIEIVAQAIEGIPCNSSATTVVQNSATKDIGLRNMMVSTDPPYYDNVPYADLSDFFYIWARPAIKDIFPSLFSTIETPKNEELVASSHRRGGSVLAEEYFLTEMTKAMEIIVLESHPALPITIYYAFKQSETKRNQDTDSTGWGTFLEAVLKAGLVIVGTWPIRTERKGRMRDTDSNALASSILLVCRKRPLNAPTTSRRDFVRELNSILPDALNEMTKGTGDDKSPIAPVDLSQAIIGPGMAVFSKYTAVLEADGTPMTVRTALQLINRFLAEDDFDADTQFCIHWFEQYGWQEGAFGEADVLARSKSTSVETMKEAGVLQSGSGKVRLFKWAEYPSDWNPLTDKNTPVWEALHQLVRALKQEGETASGRLLATFSSKTEAVRQLAYRLYTLCERLGHAEDARAYNELITSWTGIEAAAVNAPKPAQQTLEFDH
jgi:putative DNA methylase